MTTIAKTHTKHLFVTSYLFLFITALYIRFPFFFRDYVDHDESTFILIGNSIVDGHLPYDFLWDLKPPLLFYVFALVEWIFPHSLIAIRLLGVILVFISAIILIKIAKQLGIKNGFAIGLSYILFSSLFGSLQCVMSEHVAIFFFLIGLLLFLKNKTSFQFFASGILFGCELLCKLNMAYTVLALFLYYFFAYFRTEGFGVIIKKLFFHSAGIVLPFLVIALPYILQNKLKLFIDSVFMAALEYGHTTKFTVLQKLSVSAWIILVSLIISAAALRLGDRARRKQTGLIIAMLAGTVFSFYSSGSVTGHYLVQIFPFLGILIFGYIVKKALEPGYFKYALLVIALSVESHIEYYKIFNHYTETSTFYNGSAFTTVNELKKRKLDNKKIFFTYHHIGYWFLHRYPLTKSVTHPSSLARPDFFKHFGDTRTRLEEVKYIMEEIKPEVVVSRQRNFYYFLDTDIENIYFDSLMNKDFLTVYSNPQKKIYIWAKKEN